MKDSAPISQGIIAVAALFAIIGAGVAFVLYDFSLFASAVIGGAVGAVAAVILAFGWREPQAGPHAITAPAAKPAAAKPAPAKPSTAKPAATKAAAASAPVAASGGKPQFLSAARDGGPDDLKQIKGVGPKLEKTLHEMGLFHFDQIASWGKTELVWMDDNLEGFKGRASRDEWVAQAKTLAAGGDAALSKK
jgi:NADH-quinone oxidoreductase subunit E